MNAAAMPGVWADLVGQETLVGLLQRAVLAAQDRLAGGSGSGMTHAWLFTGPPGSGRSNAARAFAAALQCERGGCGECNACRTVLAGSHPDVTFVRTDRSIISVKEMRELVPKSYLIPGNRRWQVLVLEDADRINEQAANALLKSLEEPASRTVWMLCTPSLEDLEYPTVRSRCRQVSLRTPSVEAITRLLVERSGVPEGMAAFAARTSYGHVGRARRLATDEASRNRRHEIVSIPPRLLDLGSCMNAASNLHEAAVEEGEAASQRLDEAELRGLGDVWGVDPAGRRPPRGYLGAVSKLKEDQKRRRRRVVTDSIDGALLEMLGFYRDVLMVQTRSAGHLVNEELRAEVVAVSRRGGAEGTLRRMEAIGACREALIANAAPLLALESLMFSLRL
ncbi:MAG: DNA polymerase III subunit delta' [Actinomycetota bacterium]|nr:DNA polymerase III subunit delta' [Actinomycetota bacterium]